MLFQYGKKAIKLSSNAREGVVDTQMFEWNGRIDSETDPATFRYHQVMNKPRQNKFVRLIGFASEEGVRRNSGRLGAKQAPKFVREQLSSIPWTLPSEVSIEDAGDIEIQGNDLEGGYVKLKQAVSETIQQEGLAIVIGGGHETTYGNYLGVREALGEDVKLGIINIDAHYDMRPYDQQVSSGTMFLQIQDEDLNASYCVLGIQPFGNTTSLHNVAKDYDVTVMEAAEVTMSNWEKIKRQLQEFMNMQDAVYLTLCVDVLNTAYAPGVSATTPLGIDPFITNKIIDYVMQQNKAVSFDICEINPTYDRDNQTAKLGAYFINQAIVARMNP